MIHVLYHADCFDGFGAAFAIHLWNVRTNPIPVAMKFYPCKYGDRSGQELPEIHDPEGSVFIVDFSFPKDKLEAFKPTVGSLLVLDHHKTAEAQLKDLPYAKFDMERSGAMMAWNEFFPDEYAPALIEYVQDRDLWRFALKDSEAVNTYIMSFPKTFEVWNTLLHTDYDLMVQEGKAILRFEKQKVEEICAQAEVKLLEEYPVPVVNCNYQFASNVGHRLLELYPDSPFSVMYSVGRENVVRFSLRSRKGEKFFDASVIAQRYKGGGHANACGFETDLSHLQQIWG